MTRLRRFLLDCVKAFREGTDTPGLEPSIAYPRICSEIAVKPGDVPWQQACPLDASLTATSGVPVASDG